MTATTPTQGMVCNLNAYMVKKCTKFDVSHFSHSGDILGETKNFNGSCDHNHDLIGGGVSFVW